jgi:hypothetical protein
VSSIAKASSPPRVIAPRSRPRWATAQATTARRQLITTAAPANSAALRAAVAAPSAPDEAAPSISATATIASQQPVPDAELPLE